MSTLCTSFLCTILYSEVLNICLSLTSDSVCRWQPAGEFSVLNQSHIQFLIPLVWPESVLLYLLALHTKLTMPDLSSDSSGLGWTCLLTYIAKMDAIFNKAVISSFVILQNCTVLKWRICWTIYLNMQFMIIYKQGPLRVLATQAIADPTYYTQDKQASNTSNSYLQVSYLTVVIYVKR